MAKILCVDDEPSILKILKALLTVSGHDVTAVDNPGTAAEIISADTPFDLVISDIRMRPIDGLALLKLCREKRPGTPVLMITAFASAEGAEQAVRLGAVGYISKPFDTASLLLRINEALRPTV